MILAAILAAIVGWTGLEPENQLAGRKLSEGYMQGKVALVCGPVVYCLEGLDNEGDLHGLYADIFEQAEAGRDDALGVPTLTVKGWRKRACACCGGPLYRPVNGDFRPVKLRFIPYYAFANRAETDMAVWVTKF